MSKRSIPISHEKAKEVKKLLCKARNDVERNRILILVQYLSGNTMAEIVSSMLIWNGTVWRAIKRYKEKGMDFYKTAYKWRVETKRIKSLAEQAKRHIESEENLDINGLKRKLEKENGKSYKYNHIHWLVRTKLWYNYQKPFVTSHKQSSYSKEIAEWRLRKAIYKVACEERQVDAKAIKNKKIENSGDKQ